MLQCSHLLTCLWPLSLIFSLSLILYVTVTIPPSFWPDFSSPLTVCFSQYTTLRFPSNIFLWSPPALRMGQKNRLSGLCLKAAVIGTCWDSSIDRVCLLLLEPFHLGILQSFFFFKSPTYTHSASFITPRPYRKTNYSHAVFNIHTPQKDILSRKENW